MPVSTEDASWGYAGYYVHDFSSIVDEKLDRLALLHENWDCEGAKRIDPAIIQAARQFISRLPEDIGSLPAGCSHCAALSSLSGARAHDPWNWKSRALL